MKERHVILRAVGSTSRAGDFLSSGPDAGPLDSKPTGIAVEIDDLESSDVPRVNRNRDVLAVAPSMPMALIEPVADAGAAGLAVEDDWGVKAVRANTSPFSGDGIVVAVLDTGIDPAHPAFAGVTLVRRNFTQAVDDDLNGHGTHCAGTIFGRDIAGTRIGVARGIKKALIGKVYGAGGGGSDQLVTAIQWAVAEGANVISMSLGIDFPGFQRKLVEQGFPQEVATSRALEAYRGNVLLFERLASLVKSLGAFGSKSTIIVAAAGNESRRDQSADFKIAVCPPAVSDGVISVAALGPSAAGLVVASFSNTRAIVAGPGVQITSANLGGGLTKKSGTSMATPHVAGVAALWAEKLVTTGSISTGLLSSRLIASATAANLAAGVDMSDVGGGMITAPQE